MDKYIIFVDVDGTLVKPRTNDMPRVVADEFERIKKDEAPPKQSLKRKSVPSKEEKVKKKKGNKPTPAPTAPPWHGPATRRRRRRSAAALPWRWPGPPV